jgi:hypothetical protein
VGLAVVRSLDAPGSLQSVQECEDFEQELVDQFLLAAVGAGMGDAMVNENRSVIFEFARFLGRPLWTAQPDDADAFFGPPAHHSRPGQAHGAAQGLVAGSVLRLLAAARRR